jgi:hypothetical protein
LNIQETIRTWRCIWLTSPAPWNRNVFSDNFFPVIFVDAKTPAAATAAVPV